MKRSASVGVVSRNAQIRQVQFAPSSAPKTSADATACEMAFDTRQAALFSVRFPTKHVASRLALRSVDAGEAEASRRSVPNLQRANFFRLVVRFYIATGS